jgi:hypothetical protein
MAGMSSLSDEQHRMFEARLKRISKGGPNTSGHIIVGPAEPDKKTRRQRRVRREGDFQSRLGGAFGHLLVVPVSFALGGVAMMAGIVGAHHAERVGLPEVAQAGLLGQVATQAEFLIAALVILIFGWALRLTRGPRKLAVLAGFAAAFLLQDAILASNPEVFARLMPDTPFALPELASLPDL